MKFDILNNIEILKKIQQKGFFHLLSANILIQIVAFASQLFVAGILEPDDIGRIKIIQTYVSILSIIGGMGFNASILKLCSENKTTEQKNTLFRSALVLTFLTTFSVYAIVLILNYFSVFSSDKLIQWLIPLGLLPVISNSLFMVFVSNFQSQKKIKLLSNLTVSNKLIAIIGIIIFTYFGGIKGYYLALNLSLILILFVSFRVLKLDFKQYFIIRNITEQFKIHWHYARPSLFANLLSDMSAYVDIILISLFINDMNQIGFYSFALTITVLLNLFPSTVQQITCPYFSNLAHQKTDFIATFKLYNKILYSVVALTLIAVLILIPILINWFFNGKYDQSMQFFPVLAIGWSLRQLAQLQSSAIFGLGKIKYNAYINLATLFFNIPTICIAIYFYGLMGAAYASILSGLVFVLCSRWYFNKAYREME